MTSEGKNPLDILTECHQAQYRFCNFLESTADHLPEIFDPARLQSAIQLLRHDLPLHHQDESRGLFPLIQKHMRPDSEIEASIARLNDEHEGDEGFAGEIIELLETLLAGDADVKTTAAAGYMLRGFFETTRRHIAFEDEVILPFARKKLSIADLATLAEVMAENRYTTTQSLFTFGNCNFEQPKADRGYGQLFQQNTDATRSEKTD